jgi:hypothetical protein
MNAFAEVWRAWGSPRIATGQCSKHAIRGDTSDSMANSKGTRERDIAQWQRVWEQHIRPSAQSPAQQEKKEKGYKHSKA